jgi:hypothetical protein
LKAIAGLITNPRQNKQIVVKIEILLSVIYASFSQMFSSAAVVKTALRLQSNRLYRPPDNVIQLGYWNTGITIFDSKWIASETFGPSQK